MGENLAVQETHRGMLHSINVSNGGVPKRPVPWAQITVNGVEGDRQEDRRYHGGPDRALCLFSQELIAALQGEGHPIVPGSIGENLTMFGLDWTLMRPDVRIEIGDLLLEVTKATSPCKKIGESFVDADFTRVSQNVHPGWSRFYARVLREGAVSTGDAAVLTMPALLF